MKEKLVSIITPFYNRVHFLLETIETVQQQTYSNWELILINDGSTEDVSEIRKIAKKNPKITLIEKENAGVSAARNTGIAAAKGEYIALLDGDDLWDKNKLKKQIEYMEEHGYRASHTVYTLFDEHKSREVDVGHLEGNLLKTLMVECNIHTSSTVVAKEVVDNIKGPFPTRYHFGEDACFWISVAAQTEIGVIREPLTFTRQTDTTAANDIRKIRSALTNILDYVLHDAVLCAFDDEIGELYCKLASISGMMECNRQEVADLRLQYKRQERVREVVKQRFEQENFLPKVSIIIPVYKGANYMRDAIRSAVLQTYPNIEVIVVNDGSPDVGETERIARSYGDLIRYFWKENGGVSTALNLGIEKMTGEYFSWLSHDDMYEPEKIERELEALLHQDDRTTLIAEGYKVVDRTGNYLYTVNLHDQYNEKRLREALFVLLRGGINGCGMLIHKSHFERVGKFDPNLPSTQDYDLFFRMFRGQKIHYMKTANVLSRSHEEQGSKALIDTHVLECDELWIGMMDALTVEEKIAVSKTPYLFYKELWEFLKSVTGYRGAIAYSHVQMLREALREYKKTEKKQLLEVVAEGCGVAPEYLKKNILPHILDKNSKPRVLFQLGDRNSGGGLNRIVVENANALSERYNAFICSWGEKLTTGYLSCDQVAELAIGWPVDKLDEYARLLSLLEVDLYVYSYCCSNTWLSVLEKVRQVGIKTVAWSHEDYFLPYWNESLWNSLLSRDKYLAEADAVVWLNSTSQALYGMRHSNGVQIPNMSTFEETGTRIKNPGKCLVAVGRYDDARKGLGDLLRAYDLVLKKHPETELYIVGGFDLNLPIGDVGGMTCQEFILKTGIPDSQLHFVGWTEDVARYYQMGALHLMPSYYEGFGLVVLEAAANGMPTVAYGGSGMADIIRDGVDGCIVERGDWKKMAEGVVNLLEAPQKISAMQKQLPAMLKRHSKEVVIGKWAELFDTLLSRDEAKQRAYFAARQNEVSQQSAKIAIREYEAAVLTIYDRLSTALTSPCVPQVAANNDTEIWQKEYYDMQQSLSWRITKPLRLVKKVLVTWKTGGLGAVFRKVKQKLRKQKG